MRNPCRHWERCSGSRWTTMRCETTTSARRRLPRTSPTSCLLGCITAGPRTGGPPEVGSEDDEGIEDVRVALAMDDIPRVHLDHGHVVPDVKHPRRMSPYWLIPIVILSFLLGMVIGGRTLG